MKEHWFGPDGIFGTHPTRLRLTDEERAKNAEPLPPVTVETPQRFTDVEQIHPGSVFRPDPNFLADSPMSENVEDRRSYVGDNSNEKALSANTARLAELNGFVGRDATWPSGHGVASSTASPAVKPQPALALPVPWVGCSAYQPAARRPGASDGLFGPLRSPMPGGLRQPGALAVTNQKALHHQDNVRTISSCRDRRRSGRPIHRTSSGLAQVAKSRCRQANVRRTRRRVTSCSLAPLVRPLRLLTTLWAPLRASTSDATRAQRLLRRYFVTNGT